MDQKPKDLDDALDQIPVPEVLTGSDQIRNALGLDLLDQSETAPPVEPPKNKMSLRRLLGGPEIRYLPHYEGLPKIAKADTEVLAYDLICAEPEGVWLNTTGSRMVTVRCGFALLVGDGIAAQIRQVTDMTDLGVLVVNDDLESQRVRNEVRVTLVNMSTKTLKIERGQIIARMRLVPILHFTSPLVESVD